MGDIVEQILNGEDCEVCGMYIDDDGAEGFPRKCAGCQAIDELDRDGKKDCGGEKDE